MYIRSCCELLCGTQRFKRGYEQSLPVCNNDPNSLSDFSASTFLDFSTSHNIVANKSITYKILATLQHSKKVENSTTASRCKCYKALVGGIGR